MRIFLISVFLYLCNMQGILSQNTTYADFFLTDSLLQLRGEAYIAIPNSRLKAIREIPDKLIRDKITDSMTYFYINRESFIQLKESGLEYLYIVPPSLAATVQMAETVQEVLNGSGYPTYQQYLAIMDSFKNRYPTLCRIDTVGVSIGDRLILSARLNSGNYVKGEKPVLMYSSTIHGDEPFGYVAMILLIDELLKGYELNNNYSDLLKEAIVIINPLANPDGAYYMNDSTIYGSLRQNLNFEDLNRSFPEWTKSENPVLFNWQPENSAMDAYLKKYRPSLSANFHGGAEVVNYPWDAISAKHPDDKWFKYISKEFADTAKKIDPNYMSEFPDGITNGFEWYQVEGGRMDYVNNYLDGREVTIELSNEKIPPGNELYSRWLIIKGSLFNYLRQGLFGIWGTTTDSITGVPVRSQVQIPGYDKNTSIIYSEKETGKFYRYLYEGTYDLNLYSESYVGRDIQSVVVRNLTRTVLSMQMIPLSFLLEDQDILILPNPFINKFFLLFNSELPQDCQLLIYNQKGILIYSKVFISTTGNNFTEIELFDYEAGIYIVKLSVGNKILISKVIKAE